MNWQALLAGLLSGVIASMGMGGGAVLLIYLVTFLNTPQLNAQGINLLFFVPIGFFSVVCYAKSKKIDLKKTAYLSLFGILGAGLGIYVARNIETESLRNIFAGFIIVMGAKEIFSKS